MGRFFVILFHSFYVLDTEAVLVKGVDREELTAIKLNSLTLTDIRLSALHVGDDGWVLDVSWWKYFVIGFFFSCLHFLWIIICFVTFIHERMDCSFV